MRDTLLSVAGGWEYRVVADDSVERYNAEGKLLSITARNGWVTTLTYSDALTPVDVAPKPGLLIRVANHFARALTFTYEPGGRLASMVDPGGGAIRYGYDGFGNVVSVTWQDNTMRQYHHEDSRFPGHVTGITDEAGVRYSSYAYDDQGRVASSELAGGAERMSFTYGNGYSYVRDAVSTSRSYSFTNTAGVLRTSGVSQPCPLCGNTAQTTVYDANANKTKEVAHDGTVTFTAYDAKGRETERATFPASFASATTRPALASASKVVSTKWHATFNLPTQLAEPNKTTANTYNSKGMLTGQSWTATTDATGAAKFTAVKTGSTYATGWGYNSNSLLTSLVNKTDGVVTAQVSYVVNAQGITTKGTDVLTGKAITVGTSTSKGQPKSGTDAAGTPFSIAYSVTGKPTSVTIGTQPPNRFIYDAKGGLSRLEAADGSVFDLTPPTNTQSSNTPTFASMTQANAAAAVSSAAPSPISGSASSCVAIGQAAKVASKCCEGSACRVYCTGVPGNAPVYCTRVEYSTGSGWRTTNVGIYSWLDRPFNFVGQFTCAEFDQLLGDGRCGNGACLAATTR